MQDTMIDPEPIDPRMVDAAEGSVFTGEREGMNRWTPKWGSALSRADVIVFAVNFVISSLWDALGSLAPFGYHSANPQDLSLVCSTPPSRSCARRSVVPTVDSK